MPGGHHLLELPGAVDALTRCLLRRWTGGP
jgi:hypothetical protein